MPSWSLIAFWPQHQHLTWSSCNLWPDLSKCTTHCQKWQQQATLANEWCWCTTQCLITACYCVVSVGLLVWCDQLVWFPVFSSFAPQGHVCLPFFSSLFRGPHISREDESLIWKSYGRRWVFIFMLVFFHPRHPTSCPSTVVFDDSCVCLDLLVLAVLWLISCFRIWSSPVCCIWASM